MSKMYRPRSYTTDFHEYEKNDTPISVVGRLNIIYLTGGPSELAIMCFKS